MQIPTLPLHEDLTIESVRNELANMDPEARAALFEVFKAAEGCTGDQIQAVASMLEHLKKERA